MSGFVWMTINDGQIGLRDVPDFVSTDEMTDRYGEGHLLVVNPFEEVPPR